jgi:hypothetical protein
MNSLRCSNCSFLNFATASACKRCGLPFDPAAEAEWNSQAHASPEAYPQTTEGGSFFWDQPAASRPNYALPPVTASSGASKIVKILIAVAVVGIISAVAIPKLLKSGKTDFTNLNWTDYKSPDGKFSISLPVAPKMLDRTIPSPFGNADAHMLEAEVGKDGGCMLLYADYPSVNLKVTEEALYDMALRGAMNKQRMMSIGARRYITLDGHRGVEAELNPSDPNLSAVGAVRIFWVSPRLYVVGAGGPNTAEYKAVQAKCFDSFRLLSSR